MAAGGDNFQPSGKRPGWKSVKSSFRDGLVSRYFVRFHMALILTATGLSGLLFSKILLESGMSRMAVRYGISTVLSYGCFFLFIKMWLRYIGVLRDRRSTDTLDVLDSTDWPMGHSSGSGSGFNGFGGGASGGGGAGGSFEVSGGSGGIAGDAASGLLDGADSDDAIPLLLLALLIALITAVVGSAFYLVWSAPEILSEAAFQAALASGLVTRFKAIESESWEGSIFGKTALPFVVVLCLSVASGHFAQRWRPGAVKISEIVFAVRNNRTHESPQ